MMTKEMCFYIPRSSSRTRQPINKDNKTKKVVFVKKFEGYVMRDSVWVDKTVVD